MGLRFHNWKVVFMEQRMEGTMGVWAELYNLRTDPVRDTVSGAGH